MSAPQLRQQLALEAASRVPDGAGGFTRTWALVDNLAASVVGPLVEREDSLGGVWRDNTYPGAGCDVPSPLYSFSYEQSTRWDRRYGLQQQILEYLDDTALKYGITLGTLDWSPQLWLPPAANATTRPRGLSGRQEWAEARAAYERLRRDGRLPATFEIIQGHAWKAAPKTTDDGRSIVRFQPRPPAR